jgi:hypothetical protein
MTQAGARNLFAALLILVGAFAAVAIASPQAATMAIDTVQQLGKIIGNG